MRTPVRITKSDFLASSVKWDTILLPALYIFNCFTFSAWIELAEVPTKPWLALVWLYGLAVLIPLVWRDRAPLAILVTQCVLTAAAWPIMPHYTPAVGVPVAVYAVSVHYGRIKSLLLMLASFIPSAVAASIAFRVYPTPHDQIASFIGNCAFLGLITIAAWAAGRVTRASKRHIHKLEQERESARQAVFTERRRIARELHDIISHAVAVIVLQAAGASRVADTRLDRVKESLGHIETTGRQAMTELRRLLGVLDDGEPTEVVAGIGELGPQPGLRDLPALFSSLRAAGMPVTVDVKGTPRDLDPSVDLAAYRIVQEGLTNALKHAGKHANPALRLVWEVQQLTIQIDNAAQPRTTQRAHGLSLGRGLLGLRERAHAVGGALHAGPQHGDRFRLIATLPLPVQPSTVTARPDPVAVLAGVGGDRRTVSP